MKEIEEKDGEQKVEALQALQDLQAENGSVTKDTDSGHETLLDTDSEPDDQEKGVDRYIEAVGWNVSVLLPFLLSLYDWDITSGLRHTP